MTATSALSDVRVLDFTTTIAGPHCTRLLADLGAQVVKIESTEGDLTRSRPPIRDGASASYGQLNAGKKSLVLDLKQPDAVGVVMRLIETTDVLVENFRPGVMQRLGLDYAALAPRNARLIYCAISGYGQSGPSAGLPAYAPVIHAACGYDLAHLAYQDGRTRPDNNGIFIADVLAGTYAFGAILTALHHRERTGRGQLVDVSMLESMLTMTLAEIQRAQFHIPPPGRPIFGPIETRDGYIMLAVASERTFVGLARAAGREDWLQDARFAAYAERRRNWHLLVDELEQWSRALDTKTCQEAFDRFGVPCSPYRTVEEAMADPQLAHRQAFGEVRDAAGPFRVLNPPFRLSDAPTTVQSWAAALGEHSDEVLADAGFSASEIETLRRRGVVG